MMYCPAHHETLPCQQCAANLRSRVLAAPAPTQQPTIQDVMWEVFYYARIMDGFEALEGAEREQRRGEAHAQDDKIRSMLAALSGAAPTPQPELTDEKCWKLLNAAHDIADEAWSGLLLVGPSGELAYKTSQECKATGTLLPEGWQWFDCYAKDAVEISQCRVEDAFTSAIRREVRSLLGAAPTQAPRPTASLEPVVGPSGADWVAIGTVRFLRTGGNVGLAWSVEGNGTLPRDGETVYVKDAAQAPQQPVTAGVEVPREGQR